MKRVQSVLEGQHGVISAEEDPEPKTVRVRYRSDEIAVSELIKTIDRADIRLQAHHRLRHWFGRLRPQQKKFTARLLSDAEA